MTSYNVCGVLYDLSSRKGKTFDRARNRLYVHEEMRQSCPFDRIPRKVNAVLFVMELLYCVFIGRKLVMCSVNMCGIFYDIYLEFVIISN